MKLDFILENSRKLSKLNLKWCSTKGIVEKGIEATKMFTDLCPIEVHCEGEDSGWLDFEKIMSVVSLILFNIQRQADKWSSVAIWVTRNDNHVQIEISDPKGFFLSLNSAGAYQNETYDFTTQLSLMHANSLLRVHCGSVAYVIREDKGPLFSIQIPWQFEYYKMQGKISEEVSDISFDIRQIENKLFLDRVTTVIRKHIIDYDFNVTKLCRELGVSQTNLYRKLQETVCMSPNQLIRDVRMDQAHRILQMKKYPIGEVSIMVGFRDARYFSRLFKEKYGQYPGEFLKSLSLSEDNVSIEVMDHLL